MLFTSKRLQQLLVGLTVIGAVAVLYAQQPVTISGTPTVSVSGTVPVSGPLTDTQLRASAVPVSGTFWQATQPVSGTFWQATQPVSGPLTDAQLRATPVPVSGSFSSAALADSTASASLSGTGGSTAFAVAGYQSASLTLSGVWTASGNIQVSADGGTTWVNTYSYSAGNGQTTAALSANGAYSIALVGGASHVRFNCTSYTSGTITIAYRATVLPVNPQLEGGIARSVNSGNKDNGTIRVVLATDQPQLTNKLLVTPDANSAVNVAQMNGVTVTMGNGTAGTGVQRVAVASDNTAFETQTVVTAATTNALSTCIISGGSSAASTNSTNCKGSAGNVYEIHVTNTTTTNYFLRMYNASSAPTCSSATGYVETIPALGASANGGINGRVGPPQAYTTGIGFCLTGGGSSTDNTNAATGVYVTILYK